MFSVWEAADLWLALLRTQRQVGSGDIFIECQFFLVNPLIQVVGCQPEASPVMLESVRAGRVVDWESQETLSGFSMRTMSCWMWWSSGWIMSLSRLPLESQETLSGLLMMLCFRLVTL